MYKLLIIYSTLLSIAISIPLKELPDNTVQIIKRDILSTPEKEVIAVAAERELTEEEKLQNTNAKYQFSSNVEDHINDLNQQRVEVRDGEMVKGMYAYSDGYFRRTIHYEADKKGYRVTNEEVEPLEGPKIDLNGKAMIQTDAHGSHIRYTVQSVPADGPVAKVVDENSRNL